MKKTLLFCLLLTGFIINAQTPGFKISNISSPIADTTQVKLGDSSEKVYKTVEIIKYNYLNTDKKTKEVTLDALTKDLYNNSINTNASNRYSSEIIKQKEDSIKTLTSEIKTMRKELDSLYFKYTKSYLKHKKINLFSFGPVRSTAFFDLLYNHKGQQFKVLNNSGVSIGSNTGSIYSELVSGNLGIFRVSLGTMVAKSSSSDSIQATQEEAIQRLITYGGNTVLNFEYPLAYLHSGNSQYNLISRFIAKGTADFPEFGTTTEDWAGSASVGIDIYGDASLSNNALRFFFNFNYNQIFGTDIYTQNLGVTEDSFSFGQLTVGLVVAQNVKLSFVISTFSSEENLRNSNVVAGGQILH